MQITKHDLSLDLAKIDYPALLETVQLAVYHLRGACEGSLSEIQHASEKVELRKDGYGLTVGYYIAQDAKYLAESAAQLAKAAETLEVLEGMKCRSEVEFLNRP